MFTPLENIGGLAAAKSCEIGDYYGIGVLLCFLKLLQVTVNRVEKEEGCFESPNKPVLEVFLFLQ